ncbi:MAG: O-acetylhomoserine sulfhydrylase, partial [uncultured Thermoleophilia bacterium]
MTYAALPAPGPILWLEQALADDPGAPCPPLAGPTRADVAIVGGGFVGLWTAYELTERAPDLDVVLLEGEFCGAGASGRNGGWVTGWHDELDALIERFGVKDALRLAGDTTAAIERIGEVAARHGIDCDYRQAGCLVAATAPAQLGAVDGALAACRTHGREALLHEVSGEELRRRTGSPLPIGGVIQTDAAAIQPARLARGLRRVLLERGVRIHEGSAMRRLGRGRPAFVETREGLVEADRVVLALGAWSARIRELRRAVVPVGSHLVATEPIPERVRALGWTGGEAFGDLRLLVHYAQVSADGRIVFGRGGGAIGPAGRVTAGHHRDARTSAVVAADFRRFFPTLADVRLTHSWGGPVDRAP